MPIMTKSKKSKQILNKFRRLVRNVILNQSWLNDQQNDQKLSTNVKKNITILVRVQRKVGLLTMEEKSLIRTPHQARTVNERKQLVRLLAGLQCFAHIPPKVRARLVPVIKFLIVPNEHIIIKEGNNAEFVYFILTGEVVLSYKEYDGANEKYFDKILTVCIPGDCIGNAEILEDCNRKTTHTASSSVELLFVERDEFNDILLPSMGKQWFQTKDAIQSIEYLNFFSDFQIICACEIGTVHQFEALQTVYAEDKGKCGFTYFVLSGECIIMQFLQVKVKQNGKQKTHELVPISEEDENNIFQQLNDIELLRLIKGEKILHSKSSKFEFDIDLSVDEEEENLAEKERNRRRLDIKNVYENCARFLEKPQILVPSSSIHTDNIESVQSEHLFDYADDVYRETYSSFTSSNETEFRIPKEVDEASTQINHSYPITSHQNTFPTNAIAKESIRKGKATDDKSIRQSAPVDSSSEECNEEEENEYVPSQRLDLSDYRLSSSEIYYLENHFVHVGTIGPGGVFGLGEELKNRIILAATTVQCYMVPRYWLFEKEQNPGNIWQRRKFHLECTIPTREKIFDNFVNTRKWQKFKNNYIQSIVEQRIIENPTKVQDVPVICRILEGTDEI